jgi:DNA-binding response OmpR family regulator
MNDRILLIDDDPAVHEVLRAYLERDGYIVHTSVEGRDGIAMSSAANAAMLIVDLMLPDVSGNVVLREVRRRSDVPIMMLSGRAGTEERIEALAAGADDYMTKPFSPREVTARVKAVLRRTQGVRSGLDVLSFDAGRLQIDGVRHEVRVHGRPCGLTLTEYQILAALASHPGRVYSRAELTYHAHGYDFEGYDRAVDVHIKNLRHKLGDDSAAPTIIETVRGVGYRLGVEAS